MANKPLFNSNYFTPEIVKQMQDAFARDKQLVLSQFLREDFLEQLLEKATRTSWHHDYIPDQYSVHHGKNPLAVTAIAPFVSLIAGPVTFLSADILTFGHRDYTLLHDDKAKDVIECIISLMPYDESWGGRIVYRTEEDASIILPQQNQLSLVQTGNRKRFVEYVNHHVKNNGIMLIVLTFQRNKR